MHPISYVNGDNAPEPDRIVIPRDGHGQMEDEEKFSAEYSGATPENPLRERMDNYGNRWLEGGFEYPPYEGRLTASGSGTDDDNLPASNLGVNGDEPAIKKPASGEMAGDSPLRDAAELYPGPGDSSGHAGSRSDKWPATGLIGFKHPGSGV